MSGTLHVVILAAGEGKRMKSALPKALLPLGGTPMLTHLLKAASALDPDAIHVVIGAGAEKVRAAFPGAPVRWTVQDQRLGTGHAVAQALPEVPDTARVLVIPGDTPLVRPSTLAGLVATDSELALLSFIAADPAGYGRVLRDAEGRVAGIVEEADAGEAERALDEVNSGVLTANAGRLGKWLARVERNNRQREYYLTDCLALAIEDGVEAQILLAEDPAELAGANDRAQLAALEASLQRRRRDELLAAGVTLPDPDSVQIRGEVSSGCDVVLDAGVILADEIELGDGVEVGAGCVLTGCRLAAGTRIHPYSVLEGVVTTGACSIGPFARLRPGTVLAAGVKVGNFVEIKNASLASGVRAGHLSYVGDAEIGARANLGAGTITCNYDGVAKHRTLVGAGAFIGSNTALVAPVTVGDNATIGAGSVISSDAPAGALTLSRARQRTVAGWKKPGRK